MALGAVFVTLPCGAVVQSDSEAYRAACEAFYVLTALESRSGWSIERYMAEVAKQRGASGVAALRDGMGRLGFITKGE